MPGIAIAIWINVTFLRQLQSLGVFLLFLQGFLKLAVEAKLGDAEEEENDDEVDEEEDDGVDENYEEEQQE